jgi:hypothetical protein
VRAKLGNREPIFVFARKAPSRASTDFVMPHWLPGYVRLHSRIDVAIENAARFRAAPTTLLAGFDWLPFVDVTRYFPVDTENNSLVIWSRHEQPFLVKRVTDQRKTDALLRLHHNCGTHGQAREFSLTLPRSDVDEVVALLAQDFDIEPARIHVRENNKKTNILRIRKSLPFLRMVKALLARQRQAHEAASTVTCTACGRSIRATKDGRPRRHFSHNRRLHRVAAIPCKEPEKEKACAAFAAQAFFQPDVSRIKSLKGQ